LTREPSTGAPAAPTPRWLGRATVALAAAWAAMVPLSTAGTNILLLPLLVLLGLQARALWATRCWRLLPIGLALLLFGWIAVRATLDAALLALADGLPPAQARHALGDALGHYRELWLGAVLAALALHAPAARRALWIGLALGVLAVALREAWFWWRELYAVPKRISAGYTLALAAYLCAALGLAWRERGLRPRLRWLAWVAALVLAALALFVVKGRSGHLLLMVLGLALAAQWLAGRARWLGLAGVALALAAAFALSPAVRERTLEAASDLARYQRGEVDSGNSMGQRIELWRNALRLALDAPLVGQGYARYMDRLVTSAQQRYRSEPGRAHWADNRDIVKENPHQEFLLQWGAGGLPGLLLFAALLAAPWWWRPAGAASSAARAAARRPLQALQALTLAMACGCLFNSFLLDFIEGHVFMLLLALLAAEAQAAARADATQDDAKGAAGAAPPQAAAAGAAPSPTPA
jgi:O-antigen ligase